MIDESALNIFRHRVAEALEDLRRDFKEDLREKYKLTFIARLPGAEEMDIIITEDDYPELRSLIDRRLPRE